MQALDIMGSLLANRPGNGSGDSLAFGDAEEGTGSTNMARLDAYNSCSS